MLIKVYLWIHLFIEKMSWCETEMQKYMPLVKQLILCAGFVDLLIFILIYH